jgi:hypothetical protein
MGKEANGGRLALQPVRSPVPWTVWGFSLQVLGMGSVAVVMWRNIRNQGIGRHITAEMIKLAWHSELHTRSGLIVLIAGTVLYAVGSVLMARPKVSSPAGLFIAVPIAAVVGVLVLGVLVLLVAFFFLWLDDMLAGDPAQVSRSRPRVTGPDDTEPEKEPPEPRSDSQTGAPE